MSTCLHIGIDGCKDGWVAIALGDDGYSSSIFARRFDSVLAHYSAALVFGVDIPIGLVGNAPREADASARAFLEKRGRSIFMTPPRSALEAEDYQEGCERSRSLTGKAFSRQAWGLKGKIFEVDHFIADPRIHEVHPEVSFQLMAGSPLSFSKKTWGGLQERLQLLGQEGISLPRNLGPSDRVGIDDVVDAAAAAWSARRIHSGEELRFPKNGVQTDRSGRKIEIVG
jgi:predicted RNase H-like nuclease